MQILFIYSKFTFPIADSEYTFERREEQSKAEQTSTLTTMQGKLQKC